MTGWVEVGTQEVSVELGGMGMSGLSTNSPPVLDTLSFQGSGGQTGHKCGTALWRGFSGQSHHPLVRRWSKCYNMYLITRRTDGIRKDRKDTRKLVFFKCKHFSDAFEIHILNAKENEQKNHQLSFEQLYTTAECHFTS